MERGTTDRAGISGYVLFIVGTLSAALICAVVVAPAAVGFTLAVGVALAWCAWLERHPEPPSSGDPR